VLENAELLEKGFVTKEELEEIRALLSEVQEWSEDGEGSYDSCTKEQFDEKLAVVKNATSGPLEKLEASKPKPKPKKTETGSSSGSKKSSKAKPAAAEEEAPADKAEDNAADPEQQGEDEPGSEKAANPPPNQKDDEPDEDL
jgi:hypothetical protein